MKTYTKLICLSLSLLTACNMHQLCGFDGKEEELQEAIDREDLKGIEKVLALGQGNINASPFLFQAVEKGNVSIVKALLSKGADPNSRNQQGRTALMRAAYRGNADVAAALLEHEDTDPNLEEEGRVDWTALMIAALWDHSTFIEALVKDKRKRVKVDQYNKRDGKTALMYAASSNHQASVEVLLEGGASPNLKSNKNKNQTALMMAEEKGYKAVAELLRSAERGISTPPDHDEERVQRAPAIADEELGMNTFSSWQSTFDEMLDLNVPEKNARRIANIVDKQVNAGKSAAWARCYATQIIIRRKSPADATSYVDTIMAVPMNEVATIAAETAKAAGRSDQFCQKYGETYMKQKQAGKPHNWASAYASQIARGKPELYAITFANERIKGKSATWASAYTGMIVRNQKHAFAAKLADAYEAQMKAGKAKKWAKIYAMMIAQGKSPGEARAYADSKKKGGTASQNL